MRLMTAHNELRKNDSNDVNEENCIKCVVLIVKSKSSLHMAAVVVQCGLDLLLWSEVKSCLQHPALPR